MIKAYSLDLRERVLKFLEKNDDKKAASILFKVSTSTIFRWIRRKKAIGHLRPFKREYAYRKIDYGLLKKYVEEHPDHFLSEIAEKFSVTLQAIFYALKKLKITRKKSLLSTRNEMRKKEKAFLKN